MSCEAALITLGVGYLVFLNGNRETRGLRTAGRIIGLVIMAGAVLSLVCGMKMCLKGGCPFSGKAAMMCPISKDKLASTEGTAQPQ